MSWVVSICAKSPTAARVVCPIPILVTVPFVGLMVTKFEHPDSAPEQVGEFLSRMIPYNWVDPVVVGQADRKRRRGRCKCLNMVLGEGPAISRYGYCAGVCRCKVVDTLLNFSEENLRTEPVVK
jgi:hypothetical protein